MRLIGKLVIIIFIIGILLGASAYVIVYTGDNTDNNNGGKDTEPPQFDDIIGNLTVIAGQAATITVLFSDNVDVTVATLYYKSAGSTSWNSISILSGSASINIPSGATSNYYYYITVDDAAGNGPIGNPSTDGTNYYTITVKPNEENLIHTVFIEESTSVNCRYCPNVGTILDKLESSHDYRFYYVSMIMENGKAADRLKNEFNWYADPTVFIDGGYTVILGGLNPESNYTNAIQAAEGRTVPRIRVTVNAEYKNTTQELFTTVLVENIDDQSYSGRLRVYLAEIISSLYNDYNGTKYKNAFIDFIINKDIDVAAKGSATFSANWSIGTFDYQNLEVIAVVFNSEGHQAYANPLTNTNPFTAYYADAANATYVVKGARNLPPEVGILSPQKGKIYLQGNPSFNFLYKKSLLKKTFLIGRAKISIYAKDDSAIKKVELFLNDKLVANLTNEPYEWSPQKIIKRPLIPHKYTIKVIAYDDTNKTSTATIDVTAWWAI
jgi:hypothetical protein